MRDRLREFVSRSKKRAVRGKGKGAAPPESTPPVVVLGVSGGPDSTALLLATVAVREELGIEVVVAHFHHGLRPSALGGGADGDEAFVRELAARLGCRCEVGRATDLRTKAKGQGIEAAARQARYAFLHETAERVGARLVAVAHTAQDQAETVLLRIFRGTGIRGLGGMSESRRIARGANVRLVRPLLEVSRGEVERYLEARGVEARHDETNEDRRLARVRVRHEVLPLARERLNPKTDAALGRLAKLARALSTVLEGEVDSLLARAARPGCGPRRRGANVPALASFDLETLGHAGDATLEAALARVLRERIPTKVSRTHVTAVSQLVRWSARHGKPGPVALPEGQAAWVGEDGRLLLVGPASAVPTESPLEASLDTHEIPLQVPDLLRDPISGLVFQTRVERQEPGRLFLGSPETACFDLSLIRGRLAIRRRRAGDRFHPLGASGTQTLKRFFIDRKIPRALRSRIPIVTLEDLPIWVVGERIDDRFKATEATREVLLVSATPAPVDSRSSL